MLALALTLLLHQAPEQDPRLAEAVTLFQLAELDRAEVLLTILANDPALTTPDRSTALKFLAATHFAQREPEKAWRSLEALNALDPSALLDPLRFDPGLVALQAELSRAKAAEAPGPTPASKPIQEAQRPPPAASAPSPEVSTVLEPRRRAALPVAAIAAGAGLMGAGAWALGGAHARYGTWVDAPDDAPLPFSREQARTDRTVLQPLSWAALAVGGGLVGFGAYELLARPRAPTKSVQVALTPSREGGAAWVRGSF